MSAEAAPVAAVATVLAELDEALRRYTPTRHAALSGARDFSAIEALVAVPPALGALWSWADGAPELLVPRGVDLDTHEALDLLSVAEAAAALARLRDAGDAHAGVVPIAGDGAGNLLVVAQDGKVCDWDHEERALSVVHASLAELLARTLHAIRNKRLFGGPELLPGAPDPALKRMESLAKKPVQNFSKVLSGAHRVKRLKDKRGALRVLKSLCPVLPQVGREGRENWAAAVAHLAVALRAWDEVYEAAKVCESPKDDAIHWPWVGREALTAGALAVALEAFERGTVAGSGGFAADFRLQSRIGAAVAAHALGKDFERHLTIAAAEIDPEAVRVAQLLEAKPGPGLRDVLAKLLTYRAVAAHLRGDHAVEADALAMRDALCGPRSEYVDPIVVAAGIG